MRENGLQLCSSVVSSEPSTRAMAGQRPERLGHRAGATVQRPRQAVELAVQCWRAKRVHSQLTRRRHAGLERRQEPALSPFQTGLTAHTRGEAVATEPPEASTSWGEGVGRWNGVHTVLAPRHIGRPIIRLHGNAVASIVTVSRRPRQWRSRASPRPVELATVEYSGKRLGAMGRPRRVCPPLETSLGAPRKGRFYAPSARSVSCSRGRFAP
jgi:hypothetical protein